MTRWIRLSFACTLLCGSLAASAADLPQAWVTLAPGGGLEVRALVPPAAACPTMIADGQSLTMEQHGHPDVAFQIQLCRARVPATTRNLSVGGLPAPVLVQDIRRIVVLGDT